MKSKMKVYITRKVHFNAAHRIFNPEWTDEKNYEVFGGCSNPNWHGHNYTLEVTLVGTPNPETGYVYDLKKLKQLLENKIINKVDHKNLNLEVDFMQGIIPTTENFAIQIWKELEPHIQGAKLYSVKLYETERNFVEYKGENNISIQNISK
jgi:6-pyruvoyltetrahydropterin/6-carboxytetrahydropterin synthase